MASEAPQLTSLIEALCLRAQVPSITAITHVFVDAGGWVAFLGLVREYLPDHERAVTNARWPIEEFIARFENRYFPIAGDDTGDYGDFSERFWPRLAGIDWEELHELTNYWPDNQQLLLAFMASPYEDQDFHTGWVENAAQWVPQELLHQTGDGYKNDELHHMFDNTPYEPLAMLADQLWRDTGNEFMDMAWEDGFDAPEWDRELVDYITGQWQLARAHEERVEKFAAWLFEHPERRFRDVLTAIEQYKEAQNGQRTLLEVFAPGGVGDTEEPEGAE